MALYYFIKRLADIVGSMFALLVFLPIILFVIIRIKLEDGGSIIYKQERVGRNGNRFMIYKFRSMVENAHDLKQEMLASNEVEGITFKIHDDPRVTKIGKLIRAHSFDEIPQFINVIRGEMSLVGPRPALPEEVSQYSARAAERLIVTPGLSGLWQVSGRSDLSYEQMIELDLKYIETRSLFVDITIIVRTVYQMFNTKESGAY